MRAPVGDRVEVPTWRVVLRRVRRVSAALAIAVAIPLLVYLWPATLGGRSTIVFVSGDSMLPTISNDDVVVARSADRYMIGDVVVVEIPAGESGAGERIIHRLVGGSGETGWFTKGDNREYPDQWMLTDGDIVGRADVIAPLGDEARLLFRVLLWPVVWAGVVGLAVFSTTWRRLSARTPAEGSTEPRSKRPRRA